MSKLELQAQCYENLKSLVTNYKKDGDSRKTEEYLKKRITSLENQWADFETRHTELVAEIEDKNIEYFNGDIYNVTSNIVLSTKTDILNRLKTIKERKSNAAVSFDTSGVDDINYMNYEAKQLSYEHMMSKQRTNFMALNKAMSKVDFTTYHEKWELEDHLSILKTKWEIIDKMHWEIISAIPGNDDDYNAEFVMIETKYDEIRKNLSNLVHSSIHYQKSVPRVQIPEFSGDYAKWISFKDMFLETIHNNPTLTKAEKMQHLKSKLQGEAGSIVQHLSISTNNYESCWEILLQRYDNIHLQFTTFMNNMLNLPTINTPDASSFKMMHDVINSSMNGLANIGIDTLTWDPVIVHLMSQKLNSKLYEEYIKSIHNTKQLHNLDEFQEFLEGKFLAFEAKNANFNNQKKPAFEQQQRFPRKSTVEHKPNTSRIYHTTYGNCPLKCDEQHVLMRCPKFIAMDVKTRNKTVAKLQFCKNCLFKHGDNICRSDKFCKECKEPGERARHHTLLHYSNNSNKNNNSTCKNNAIETTSQLSNSMNHLTDTKAEVLLPTAYLKIKSENKYITLRALVDQGSQGNLITENAAQLLRLKRNKQKATISGVGLAMGDCKGQVTLTCQSTYSDFTFEIEALVMKKITNNLPSSSFEATNWPHISNLKLADPQYNKSSKIDILLGAEVYAKILLDGVLKHSEEAPIAQQTQLGWILCGKLNCSTLNCHVTLIDVAEMTKFWETENITPTTTKTNIEGESETYYKNTITRADDGKYIVRMPLKPDYATNLGHSRNIAVSQFLQLEKRFARNQKLATMYRDFIAEYQELGHMKLSTNSFGLQCFLPHHGVLRESSTTTKLRTVFNASQKTSTGYSLNDVLEKGDNLLNDIQEIILKWRTYKYAFTADIEKMYRAIWQAEDQQSLQKIIWRNTPNEALKEYQLCTITYGVKTSPWLAVRTLRQLALDEGHKYPEAAKAILTEFFMDDLVSGHNSLEDAEKLQKSLIQILKNAGINLRKWTSNDPKLLQNLKPDQISTTNSYDFKNEDSTKTLGLCWNTKTDVFNFNWSIQLNKNNSTTLTKRELLSPISKLYDPLGWMSPITPSRGLYPKQLINHKLWWNGPESLTSSSIQTFHALEQTCIFTTNLETKTQKCDSSTLHGYDGINSILQKYSSLIRTIRARGAMKHNTSYLTTDELKAANEQLINFVQHSYYNFEYQLLLKNETLPRKSELYKMNPYIDEKGKLIRVGGRLKNSALPSGMKNPIILLIKEDNLPPGKWAMGRIEEVHPGADGLVRVTTVKTMNSILKRPIVKLAPLPINTEAENLENYSSKQQTNNDQPETRKPRQRNYTRKQPSVLTLITLLLLFVTGSYGETDNVASSFHLTNIEPGRPAYYDTVGKIQLIHDNWSLVTTVTTDDIHQYAASYSGLTLIVVAGLAWFGRKRCTCKRPAQNSTTTTNTHIREEIQLHQLTNRRGGGHRNVDTPNGGINNVSFKIDEELLN